MKKLYVISVIALALLACNGCQAQAKDTPEKDAQKVAEAWMPLWDSGRYDESYEALAEHTKKSIPRRQWFVYWTAVRKPLGKLKSRKLVEATYIKSLPGAPEYEGVVLRYESSFENKEAHVESFGLMREKGGEWHVSDYITP